MSVPDLIGQLRRLTSPVVTDPAALQAYTQDWWPRASKSVDPAASIQPRAAIQPASRAELEEVVRACAQMKTPLVPFGGGSNVVGAIHPSAPAVVVDFARLNRIEAVNRLNHTVRVEAGVRGGDLEEALQKEGFTLGHYPQSLHLSTVGGWIAMRATGTFSTKYGGIEDFVADLEVILSNGTIFQTRPTPRSATGPNLAELFIGAEGAFGVISAATLKVRPIPEERRLRAFGVPSISTALDAIRGILQQGVTPAVIRLYDLVETAYLAQHMGLDIPDCLLLLGFDGPRRLVEVEEMLTNEALARIQATALGSDPAQAWYETRYNCEWLENENKGPGHLADAIEVSANWDRLEAVLEAGIAVLQKTADEVWYHFSHFYPQGASVYFIFFLRRASPDEVVAAYDATWQGVMRAVLDAGGSMAHHHGVGQVRLPWLREELGTGLDLLRRIKSVLDPTDILNPGRLNL